MNESLLRLIWEHAVDLYRLNDLEGRVVYASPSTLRLFGRTPAHHFENVHSEDLERHREWWQRVRDSASATTTFRVRDAVGAWRWIESRGVLVEHEGIPHILTSCRDVTERMETLRLLRESEAKLSDAQRMAHLGHWEHDFVADRLNWSEETYRILGLHPNETIPNAMTLLERTHPDDVAIQTDALERAQRGEARYDVVYRIVRPDGDVRVLHSAGELLRDALGRPQRAFGIVQDITETKRAEEERALMRSLIDHANDALEIVDPATGRFLDVNQRACADHGYTREEYLQLRVADIDPIVAEQPWDELTSQIRKVGARIFESQHRRKDGSVFPVEINLTHVARDREYVLAIVRDITERKRAEQELKQMEEQFRHAQKMEAVGRLASGVAHDFNNLVTVISGNLAFAAQTIPKDHPMTEALEEIRAAGERAGSLTRQLLAVSRKQRLEPRVVDLNAALKRLADLLRRLIGEHIEVSIVSGDDPAPVKLDPSQFDHALLNLAVNARDAMPRGGRLTIETREPDQHSVLVIVSDTGEGMDEATRRHVFEPFFTTKPPGRGTGLGLAMVHGFVEQSGGSIDVSSEPSHGTTFTLRFPRSTEPVAVGAEADAKSTLGNETVLLAEDEDAVRRLASRTLQARGYRVLEARDGQDAVSVSRAYPAAIDLLVADMVMPNMSGTDAARVLARERPALRLLLISGYSDLPLQPGEARPAFLRKPFHPDDLGRRVREVLDADQPRHA
jgi:two-component system, cell cycle sensor histidine kinase and response regulator CckA